jgi:hypothetical protein
MAGGLGRKPRRRVQTRARRLGRPSPADLMSRWAIAPVFQLLDIRREPGLSPVGYQFVSREDSYRCA